MILRLKFVLMESGGLFLAIGDRNYHQDMAKNAPRSKVKAAGWVVWNTEHNEGYCFGESIGYRIGFRDEHEDEVLKIMERSNTIVNEIGGETLYLAQL